MHCDGGGTQQNKMIGFVFFFFEQNYRLHWHHINIRLYIPPSDVHEMHFAIIANAIEGTDIDRTCSGNVWQKQKRRNHLTRRHTHKTIFTIFKSMYELIAVQWVLYPCQTISMIALACSRRVDDVTFSNTNCFLCLIFTASHSRRSQWAVAHWLYVSSPYLRQNDVEDDNDY